MAFRDEIDALRERAENAEKELASQTDRIGRVGEIEGQLEDARRAIREGRLDRRSIVQRGLPWLALGLTVGGGLVYAWIQGRVTDAREAAVMEGIRLASAVETAEGRAEAAEREAMRVSRERDDGEAARLRLARDVESVVRLAASGAGGTAATALSPAEIALGTVSYSETLLVPLGSECSLVVPSRVPDCAAEIRCAAEAVGGLGCSVAPETIAALDGTHLRIDGPAERDTIFVVFGDPPLEGLVETPFGSRPMGTPILPTRDEVRARLEALGGGSLAR